MLVVLVITIIIFIILSLHSLLYPPQSELQVTGCSSKYTETGDPQKMDLFHSTS